MWDGVTSEQSEERCSGGDGECHHRLMIPSSLTFLLEGINHQ